MIIKLFRESNPFTQLILSLALTVVVFTVVFVLALIFAFAIFPLSIENLTSGLTNMGAENINMLKYLQLVQGVGLFIVPSILLAYIYSSEPGKWLSTKRKFSIQISLITLALMVIAIPAINVLAEWNAQMKLPEVFKALENSMKLAEERAAELTKLFLLTDSVGGLLFNLLLIAVIPAIGEEFFFRGVLQKHLTDITKNIHWGVIITALVFSAFHMQFYGFLPRFLLGLLFGYMLIWSGSMWLPVLAHFVNNGVAVIAYFFLSKNGQIDKIEEIGANANTWFIGLAAAIGVVFLLVMLKKKLSEETAVI